MSIISKYISYLKATRGRQPDCVAGPRKVLLDMIGADCTVRSFDDTEVAHRLLEIQSRWIDLDRNSPSFPERHWPTFRALNEFQHFLEWCVAEGAAAVSQDSVESARVSASDALHQWLDEHCQPALRFGGCEWDQVPATKGVYLIYDQNELIYVGMAGRGGKGNLRSSLKDDATGQVVNMFAQHLFLDRVQFTLPEPARTPKTAKAACRSYIADRCSFTCATLDTGEESGAVADALKACMKPSLNG